MRIIIKIITISGNNNKAAKGTDTFEFPFNRIRLLKKANLGNNRSFCLPKSSSEGMFGDEGIRFIKSWTSPMMSQMLQRVGGQVQKALARPWCSY